MPFHFCGYELFLLCTGWATIRHVVNSYKEWRNGRR
jgi:hypothetical protein